VNDRNLRWAEGRVFVALLRQSCCERMQQDFSASGLGSWTKPLARQWRFRLMY